ncbi:MAG: transporter [Candidatus Cloacimonetes bacterium]|nr:transporter [Candidatus Cloacimonadota bacterium]
MKLNLFFICGLIILVGFCWAQNEIHLFQNFYRDAMITSQLFLNGSFQYSKSSMMKVDWTTMDIGIKAGYPISDKLEADAGISFISISPDEGDGESGLSDVLVSGKYCFKTDPVISAGAFMTLPVGSEDIGQSNLNFGFWGAIRHRLSEPVEINGSVGLDFVEGVDAETGDTEYKNDFVLGGGAVYSLSEKIALVPELTFTSDSDYSLLSCGIDYSLSASGKMRGMLGLGLDDGAPDILLHLSYLTGF